MRQRSQWIYNNAIRRWRDKTRRWHIWSSFFSDGWRGHKYVQSVFSRYTFYFKSSFIFHWVYIPNFSQLSTIAAGRILTNYRSTLEYVVSFNWRPWLSPISLIHYYSVVRYYDYRKGRLRRCTWDIAVNIFQNFHLIRDLLIEGKFSKILTVKSSDTRVILQCLSVQQSNTYRGWM